MAVQQISEQAQARAADSSMLGAFAFFGLSFIEVLQVIGLTLTIACGAFSLYFHIKRFLKERKAKKQ